MGRRLWVLWALSLLGGGCRALETSPRPEPVQVHEISASFTGPERGELRLTLAVANPEHQAGAVTRIVWELWLGGRWFAAGVQAVQEPLPASGRREVELVLPLSFRRVEIRPEPTQVELGIRGGVDLSFGGNGYRLPFQTTRRIVAQGAPVAAAREED